MTASPPAWWCGLKSYLDRDTPQHDHVTTCVVVWIEMVKVSIILVPDCVTTCVVVWIEITGWSALKKGLPSPPAWWCGLKLLSLRV